MTLESSSDRDSDAARLDDIGVEECWQLVATRPVGRVAVVVGRYPLVFPVNFVVDGQAIVYRTGVGAKLRSINRSNVTFEVDEIDLAQRCGWSVMVKGVAQELDVGRDHRLVSQSEVGDAKPWAPGERDHVIRIIADEVTGRRIHADELPPATDPRGYL